MQQVAHDHKLNKMEPMQGMQPMQQKAHDHNSFSKWEMTIWVFSISFAKWEVNIWVFNVTHFMKIGVLEYVSRHPNNIFKIWLPRPNDFHSETRVEIMCKKAGPNPKYLLPGPDSSMISWN